MSTANAKRSRAQKHQNTFAFRTGLYGLTRQQKAVQDLQISGVCARCKDILQWKIKYGKYKPLTVASRCTKCEQKNVKKAYHQLCQLCALKCNLCPKCVKTPPIAESTDGTDYQNSEASFNG
ncbi:uncharacterized protein C9orf85 homolog [Varroa jacobsoni]|uniref:Uncharacterized protein n=1 Tax=Varroa destructor TaxID=109461 RepID=A0A7M7JB76_VARDE|nr:uncharacterized protein C9orf85 homolog [Varroa destructor]XP_022695799.1 uncharacterized protein C9orf85 homolog [Varroa jacobsoni]